MRLASPGDSVAREVESLADEWDAAADRAHAVPFLRPGWVASWWRAFGTGELEIHTVRRGNRLAGVLPLHRPARRAPAFKTEPFPLSARTGTLRATANWQVPKQELLVEDAEAAGELAAAVFDRGAPLVSLAFFGPGQAGFEECLEASRAAGYRALAYRLSPSPYVDIDGDWESYERSLDPKFRADNRRRGRSLEEAGDVSVEVADGTERLDELLVEGFRTEPSGWKAKRGSAIASRPATRGFYTDVARWAAGRGCLRLAFLRVDGRPAAFQLAIEEGGVYYFLKGGFDPAYERFAPARLLVRAMLARAFSTGLARFDFLGGAEPWKLEWTTTCQERLLLHAFAPTARGAFERLALAHGRPLRARARRHLRALRDSLR